MSKITGIYKITSPVGKIYIGQTRDFRLRRHHHKNSKPDQRDITVSFNEHGFKNHVFEMLHEMPFDVLESELMDYETFFIKQYKEAGFTMLNMNDGGRGCGYKHTEENKKLMSEIAKQRGVNPGLVKKMHEANRGKTLSPERREKIRQSLLGKKHTAERIAKIKANRKLTDESKRKISESLKKRYAEKRS